MLSLVLGDVGWKRKRLLVVLVPAWTKGGDFPFALAGENEQADNCPVREGLLLCRTIDFDRTRPVRAALQSSAEI